MTNGPKTVRAGVLALSAMDHGILVGLDGSQESSTAVCWAADEARRHGVPSP